MLNALPAPAALLAFVLASVVLAATPGPGVIYIVTRTLSQGRGAGLASVAGVALGNLGNALGTALGLAALLAVSAGAFFAVKLAGAAYLIYLGVKALRGPPPAAAGPRPADTAPTVLRDGALVALLNPKTALFFAAFLPQFMQPGVSPAAQSVLLGALFVAVAAVSDTLYVLAASAAAPALVRRRGLQRFGRYATAAVYLALGVYTAAAGGRPAR